MLAVISVWLALLALLTVHELGHYVAARLVRIRVIELSLGVGPKLFTLGRLGDADVNFRALPIAAYVRFADAVESSGNARATGYHQASRWRCCVVDLAGAVANYLVAVAIVFGLAVAGHLAPEPAPAEPPADTEARTTAVEPRTGPSEGGSHASRASSVLDAARLAVLVPAELTRAQLSALVRIVFAGETERLEGPVGLARQLSAEVARGFFPFASALVIFSVAIGFINLLPVPGLDGGRLLLHGIAAATGRELAARTFAKVQLASLTLLLLLIAALTATEIDFPLLALGAALVVPAALGALFGTLFPGAGRGMSLAVVGSIVVLPALSGIVAFIYADAFFGLLAAVLVAACLVPLAALGTLGYRRGRRLAP